MMKVNEDEHIIASQSNDEEKIGDEALAAMQKALAEIDKLENEPKDDATSDDADSTPVAEDKEEVIEEVISEPKKEKPLSKESKYRKLQNDKYRALAEKEDALRKVEELERLLSESLDSGTYHYSKSAYSDLERAKQDKKIAIENGDVEALIEADIALTEAISAVNEVKKWTSSEKRTIEPAVQSQRPAKGTHNYDSIQQEIAQDWLDTHSYLRPNSRNYNPTLAKQVGDFVNELDDNLRRNNQMDLYFSDDYFDTIDEFINTNIRKTQSTSIRTAPSSNHIGGVRHGQAPSVNGGSQVTQKVQLSADEKAMAKDAGISEAAWIKQKIMYSKQGV